MSEPATIYAVGGQVLTITWYCVGSDGASPPLLVGKTGLSDVKVGIRRRSDDYWYDWSSSTFKNTGWTTRFQTMTQVDATNEPGDYEVDWTVPSGADSYVLVGQQAAGDVAVLLRAEVIVDAWPATATAIAALNDISVANILDATLTSHTTSDSVAVALKILKSIGLANYTLDNITYDGNGLMSTGRLRLWDSSANVPSSGGGTETTGLLATITVTGNGDTSYPSQPSFVKGTSVET